LPFKFNFNLQRYDVVSSLLGNVLAMTCKGKDWHGAAVGLYTLNQVDP
jgi:hypothetical protein